MIRFASQDAACSNVIPVPLGREGLEREAFEALRAYLTGPKWSGWCNERIDAETADEIDRIIVAGTHRAGIVVDRTKLDESWASWVHVLICEPLMSLVDHAAPTEAILTWPNSD